VLLELIEEGIEARKQKEKAFFDLAERYRASQEPGEVKKLGDELGRFAFGEQRLKQENLALRRDLCRASLAGQPRRLSPREHPRTQTKIPTLAQSAR
jgi:hypothetical protein